MVKTRKIKIIATYSTLNWKSEKVSNKLVGETDFDDYDSEKFMKALNFGDLSSIPSPFKNNEYSTYGETRKIFGRELDIGKMDVVETEPILGVKYVISKMGKNVSKWTYSNE